MSPQQDAQPVTTKPASSAGNPAHVRTVRLPDGEIFAVELGWNALPTGGRVFLRRDGSVMFESGPPAKSPQAAHQGSVEVAVATPAVEPPYRGSRPPFAPGNTVALKHGAESPRVVEPLAAELVTTTLKDAPFLAEPSFNSAVQAWARAEARCALLATWLDTHGLLDDAGVPRPSTKLMTSLETLALKLRTRLGLDAASRAGIEASLTSTAASQASLEAALDRGAALIRERVRLQAESQAQPAEVTA